MCTSMAAKPARSKAAAISTWPLTPCSRRMATCGRTPFLMYGAAMSSLTSKPSLTDRPGLSSSSSRSNSWSAQSALSRRRWIW
ncbi:hypothetical protein D3C76_988370 [compost metagenome]